ncbi:30S ribosomal protein S18 [Rickettsiales endosymbiont of Paramecium tredecaurelia]|uniref:30S ribosomal protein S18 n=1 Tax=Candidatus Sarmatiella mevalonica TaxID=2770581 RepID=UPI00192152EF|nr:30S ribosomal protein S18 [Candidatus Sarmatiella mevalonica]MBL3284480.1 30S ribosomal protein S18 [Candidatus Sarmatiella mevalonica]
MVFHKKRGGDSFKRPVFTKRNNRCPFSAPDAVLPDYKNLDLLLKFVSNRGRILPSRITGVSAKRQRLLKQQIKIARLLALMPFVGDAK